LNNELDMNWVWLSLAMGVGATLTLDLWAQLLRRAVGIMPTDWGLVGRWVVGIPRGRFQLRAEPAASHVAYELPLGWLAHYAIGVCYAFIYLVILQIAYNPPSLLSAAMFGLVTVLAPWLILLPGLGKGWFGSATPKPNMTRFLNVVTHLVFGVGLYLAWRVTSAMNF